MSNAIKAAAERADQMIAELAKQSQAPEAPEEETPVEEVVPEQDQGVAVEPDPVEEPRAESDAAAQLKEDAAKWEQRYRSLDGMLQSRDRQIADLHQLLANMQAAGTPKPEPAAPKKPLVTPEDEATYGADLLDVTRRVSRDEMAAYTQALEARLAGLQQQVQGMSQVTAETVQERFHARLTQIAPTWETIDKDPAFLQWLKSSPVRYRIFEESAQAQDTVGVAQFFQDYEMLTGKPETSAPTTPPAVDPRLARQVSPGKSRGTPTPTTDGNQRQWTQSGMREFFTNKLNNKYPKEEAARLEREVFAAMKDGRVDYSR